MSANVLRFPKPRKTCQLCGGTLIPIKHWHTYHRECFAWVYRLRAMPFLLAASDVRVGGR